MEKKSRYKVKFKHWGKVTELKFTSDEELTMHDIVDRLRDIGYDGLMMVDIDNIQSYW